MKAKPTEPRELNGEDEPLREAATKVPASGPFGFKKILVPIDFSESSLQALEYAVAFANQFGASICLVHVVEPASFPGAARNGPPAASDREAANKLHHKLVMLARKEIDPLTPVHPFVCVGKPFDEIVRTAKTFRADLILIATHGRTGFKRAVLGSTAERVVRHAHCPVLVVRQKARDFLRGEQPSTERDFAMKIKPLKKSGSVVVELNPRDAERLSQGAEPGNGTRLPFKLTKILVPIDFSDCSKKALQYAIPLAKQHQAALTLLYVVVVPRYYGVGDGSGFNYVSSEPASISIQADLRANAEKQLATLTVDEVRGEVESQALVRTGAPAIEIIEVAHSLPADLIVISTHGRTGLKHVWLGSVAEHVVRRAPCPVLVVREQEREFVAR